MKRWTTARGTGLAVLLTSLAVAASGCGGTDRAAAGPTAPSATRDAAGPSEEPAQSPVASPAESPAAPGPSSAPEEPHPDLASDDGTWHAEVVRAESTTLVLDKVEILSGAAAEAARAEDGRPDPGADVPYVRNRNGQLRSLPVAGDVEVQVIDCPQDGCGLVAWSYADLVAGTPLPYGTPSTPFSVTVVDGRVVALAEVYFP